MTFVVDAKIWLNEKKLQHLYQHFQSELVKWILYDHRKFKGDSVPLNNGLNLRLALSSVYFEFEEQCSVEVSNEPPILQP